ncbi:MAG: DUF4230 domain-containing protein [Bacteroidales bacterium]|nr:DUF4230 domain-containing protein [Bacteroidales bacterium]
MCFRKKNSRQLLLTRERLRELTSVSDLSTTEYTVEKIVKAVDTASAFKRYLAGERKVLYSCKIYIKAGIDMKKYDPDKTEIDLSTMSISITLPKAGIISFDMPAEEQDMEYTKVGLMRRRFSATESNELLVQGEKSVYEAIHEMGILEDAERNTRDFFSAALYQLGYHIVNIKFEAI